MVELGIKFRYVVLSLILFVIQCSSVENLDYQINYHHQNHGSSIIVNSMGPGVQILALFHFSYVTSGKFMKFHL